MSAHTFPEMAIITTSRLCACIRQEVDVRQRELTRLHGTGRAQLRGGAPKGENANTSSSDAFDKFSCGLFVSVRPLAAFVPRPQDSVSRRGNRVLRAVNSGQARTL